MNSIFNAIYQYRGYLSCLVFGSTSLYLYNFNFNKIENIEDILNGLDNKVETTLINKKIVTHDTILLEFKLPNDKDNFGLPIGNNIRMYGFDDKNNEIFRNYTPVSKVNKKGSYNILLKVYHPNERFPKGGILSQYINNLSIGSKVKISGPEGNLVYKGNKVFSFKHDILGNYARKFSKISLVGGGTGITPLYQLIKHIVEEDTFNDINLLFANKSESDILLKNELIQLNDSKLANVKFSVDASNNKNWKGYVGFIKKDWLKESFPSPSKEHLVCVCGPPIMSQMVKKQLMDLGHDLDNIYIF